MPPRVLMVDDDCDLRTMCTSVLRTAGIEVLAGESAEAGLGILEREACELAILDVKLPGMSGLALGVIAAEWPTLPGLVATGSGEEREAEVRARGARGFLRRPFSKDELLAGVEEALVAAGTVPPQEGAVGRPSVTSGGRDRQAPHRLALGGHAVPDDAAFRPGAGAFLQRGEHAPVGMTEGEWHEDSRRR